VKALTQGIVNTGDGGESANTWLEAELAEFIKQLPDGELTQDQVAAVEKFAMKIVARRGRGRALIK
jgi:hypothetical protein